MLSSMAVIRSAAKNVRLSELGLMEERDNEPSYCPGQRGGRMNAVTCTLAADCAP